MADRQRAPRRRRRDTARALCAVLIVAGLGAGLSACSEAGAPPSGGQAAAASSTPAATASGGATPGATPGAGASAASSEPNSEVTGTPDPPLPNPAPSNPTKAIRAGQAAAPVVSAAVAPFSAPATYSDSVTLVITKAAKHIESGNGPGVFAGREFVTFDVELTNGSSQAIDLNQVVVTTSYGATHQIAPPVYTPSAETSDFGGSLAPGAKATARFGFALPATELGNVTMVIDFDAVHTSATFSGALTVS